MLRMHMQLFYTHMQLIYLNIICSGISQSRTSVMIMSLKPIGTSRESRNPFFNVGGVVAEGVVAEGEGGGGVGGTAVVCMLQSTGRCK